MKRDITGLSFYFRGEQNKMKAIRTQEGGFYPQIDGLSFSDNFVYYSSLLGASKNYAAYQTGVGAHDYLYSNNIFNPTKDGKTSNVIEHALNMLEKAAANERRKENHYIEALRKKFPNNEWLKKKDQNYELLIMQLNSASKRNDLLQKELDAEYKRWSNYMENYSEVEKKKRRYLKASVGKDKELAKQKKAEYDAARRAFVGSSELRKVGEFEKTLLTNWNKNTNSIANMIKTIVIEKFGQSLFKMQDGKLVFDQAKITLLIKELSVRIYETLLFESGWKDSSGTSKKRNWLIKNLDNVVNKAFQTNDADAIIKSLESTAITNSHVGSILQNYANSGYSSISGEQIAKRLNENNQTLNRLRQFAKKAYIKATGDSKANRGSKRYKEWIKNNPQFSDRELIKNSLAIESIKVQAYYTSEDRALERLAFMGASAALEGSGHNTKSDIEAGVLTIEMELDDEDFKTRLSQEQEKIFNSSLRKFQNLKVDSSSEGFSSNYETFLKLRQEQLDNLQAFKETLTQEQLDIAEALTYFNIHTSVKDQTGNLYKEMGAGFYGGSIGKNDNALSALENIKNLYEKSGTSISESDLIWLKTAILNSGSRLMGAKNKSSLEAYFSMFASYLMFDDAYNIVEDAFDDLHQKYSTNLPDIHLYVINTQMIPLSYMLTKIHEELKKFSLTLKDYQNSGNKGVVRTIISGYSGKENPGYTEKD